MRTAGGLLKHTKRSVLCTFFVLLIVIILWIYFRDKIILYSDFVDCTISLIAIVVAAISVILIVIQLRESQIIQEAEFIVNLNQAFVGNSDYAKMYTELETSNTDGKEPNLSRVEISNYLTFFETIYLLLDEKVIKIEMLDDLFEYRFFIAVHNETVQKAKLIDAPYNFRNIFLLEKIWMDYRKERGLSIFKEEYSLEKACAKCDKSQDYNNIISKLRERRR